jgi:exopolyphosphatase/guanosine-5'-triphosphate,3'-diphosphate pyrophosphatase
MKLEAIDIGSNSIHLVIVRAIPGQNLEIIDREKEMVRLGSVTLRSHRLSRQTIDRAVETLRRFKKMAEANRVDLIIATATSAVRESDNADEFIETVRKSTGLDVQLLPGVEEARLIALAVSEVTDFNGRRGLIIDLGGGSTEFIVTRGNEPDLLLSVRLGAVRLTEKFITTDPISDEERERLVANIRTDLIRAVNEIMQVGFDFVTGTSGTILNMVDSIVYAETGAGLDEAAQYNSFSKTISSEQLKRLNRRLAAMTQRERSRIPGIEKGRADIIIAGGVLLETILSELGATEITSCDWSLREGVILDYLRKHHETYGEHPDADRGRGENSAGPVSNNGEQPLDVRTRSVLSVARRYEYDREHSHHVADLAVQIFDGTHDLHGMGEKERKLLEYAALLHDIGYHISHNNHHRHGLYLIKNSEMPGFTGTEIAVMAAAVRYHRGSMPRKTRDHRLRRQHEDFLSLDRAHRTAALRLASILQIADGLDRSYRQNVRGVRCELSGSNLRLIVEADGECDLEIWAAERKSKWFQDIFHVTVTVERGAKSPSILGRDAAITAV